MYFKSLLIFFLANFINFESKKESNEKEFILFESISLNNIQIKNEFILDTGSNISILDESIFKKLNLKQKGTTNNIDILGNKKKRNIYTVEELKINETLFLNVDFIVLDLKKHFNCENIPGIIGTNVLKENIIKIDFNRKNARLINTIYKKSDFNKFQIKLKNNLPFVNLYIRNKKKSFLLDTGDLNPLTLKNKDFKFTKSNTNKSWKIEALVNSINDLNYIPKTFPVSSIKEIHIGKEIKMNSSIAIFSNYRNIGIDFFKNTTIILDFKNKEGFIKKGKKFDEDYSDLDRFISIAFKENYFYVSQITKDGYYKKKYNVKLGDTLESINSILLYNENTKLDDDNCLIKTLIKKELKKFPLKIKFKGKEELLINNEL